MWGCRIGLAVGRCTVSGVVVCLVVVVVEVFLVRVESRGWQVRLWGSVC